MCFTDLLATRVVLAAVLAVLFASYGALACNTASSSCFYIRESMSVDPTPPCGKPNGYGDKECHPSGKEASYTISGCGNYGYYDNRGGSVTVGAAHPLQYRVNSNGVWKTGAEALSGFPSVWYRCGRS